MSFPSHNFLKKPITTNTAPYFSAARKIPDAQSALNSGSQESRKYRSSFIMPRMLLPLTRAKLSSIARLRKDIEDCGSSGNSTYALMHTFMIKDKNPFCWVINHLLMDTSRSFKQSTIVLRCLCTALWSVWTVFSRDVNATYLRGDGVLMSRLCNFYNQV